MFQISRINCIKKSNDKSITKAYDCTSERARSKEKGFYLTLQVETA